LLGPGGGMIGGLIYLSGFGLVALVLLHAKAAYFFGGVAISAIADVFLQGSKG
jgi:hypothetical protein